MKQSQHRPWHPVTTMPIVKDISRVGWVSGGLLMEIYWKNTKALDSR